jgi:hypothetical protein
VAEVCGRQKPWLSVAVAQFLGGAALQRCEKRFLFIEGFRPPDSGIDFSAACLINRVARNIETMHL